MAINTSIKLGVILVLLLGFTKLQAQENYLEYDYHILDSLRAEGYAENSIEIIDSYYFLGFDYFTVNVDSTRFYVNKVMELSKSVNYQLGMASAFYLKGIINDIVGNEEQSLAYYKIAKDIFEQENDTVMVGNCFGAIGLIQGKNGYYTDAIKSHKKSFSLVRDYSVDLIIVTGNLISAYLENQQPDSAMKYLKLLSAQVAKSNSISSRLDHIDAKAHYWETLNDLDSAVHYYKQGGSNC
ncbi:MAG: hypothetical protein ACPGEG_00165 [Salibacteraceae bacterium]